MSESIEVAKIFKHAQYGQLRACVLAEEKYFVGRDVARMFNMKDASKAFRRRVDAGDKIVRAVRTDGQCHTLLLISENGLRSFLGALDTPTARAVAAWLQEEFAAEPENHLPKVFDIDEFGRFRFVQKDDEFWFVAADVCRALDIQNASQAAGRLDPDERHVYTVYTLGGEQEMLIVNEPGLYRLLMQSRKPEAKVFQRKVYHEVLPALRRQGTYSLHAAPALTAPEEVVKLKKQLKGISKVEFAVVYAFLMGNGSVKIGMTSNLTERAKQLQTETGCEVLQFKSTPFMIKDEAAARERELLEKFAPYREAGEFFDVKFTLVAAEL